MPSKKLPASVTDVTVRILTSIRDEIHELRADSNARFESLEQRLGTLETTTARGFEAVTARLEHIRDFTGERWRDHERRIRRLEARSASR